MAEEFKHCTDCNDPPECGSWASCFNRQMRRSPMVAPLERNIPPRHNDNAIPDRGLPGYMGGGALDDYRVTSHNAEIIPGYTAQGSIMKPNEYAKFGPSGKPRLDACSGKPGDGRYFTATALDEIETARRELANRIVEDIYQQTKTGQGTPLFHAQGGCALMIRDIIVKHLQEIVS